MKPSRRHRDLAAAIVLIAAAGAFMYWHQRGESPKPAAVEEAGGRATRPERQPRAGALERAWDSLRESLNPSKKSGGGDLLEEESQAAEALGLLKRLIELDPRKDADEIAEILDGIQKIGYPALTPLRDMIRSHPNEKITLLLLAVLGRITDADVKGDLRPLMTAHPAKSVRDRARAMFLERATPEEQQKYFSDTKAALGEPGQGTKATTDNKLYMIEALEAGGRPESFDTLKEIARSDPDEAIRQRAVRAIGVLGTADAQAFLLSLVLSDAVLRGEAAAALGKVQSDAVTGAAIAAFKESADPEVKLALISVVGGQKTQAAGDFLVELIRTTDDERILRAAGEAAGRIAGDDMVQAMIDILKGSQGRTQRRAATAALAAMGEKAVPFLKGAALKDEGKMRKDAIRALSQMRKPQGLAVLKELLESWTMANDPEAQRELITGLKNYGDKDAVPAIERVAEKASDESVRRRALEAVADMKQKDSMEFVVRVYQMDQSETVKRGALRMMRRYGGRDTANILRQELLSGRDPQLKEEIEKAIEEIEKRGEQ